MIIASGCSFCNEWWVESLGTTLNDSWINFMVNSWQRIY